MIDNLDLFGMVELSNHLSDSLNLYYRDVNDIDIVIEQLNRKKKEVLKRMESSSNSLRLLTKTKVFRDGVTVQYQNGLTSVLDEVDSLIKSQSLKG